MNLLNTIFFQHCMTCKHKQARPITHPICSVCQNNLPWLTEDRCTQCAIPLTSLNSTRCGNCITSTPAFDQSIVVFSYEYPINLMICDFKFSERWRLASIFGKWMQKTLSDQWHTLKNPPSHIIACPMHDRRLADRGYNQALLLTKYIMKAGCSLRFLSPCKKISNNIPQTSLSRKQREKSSPNILIKKTNEIDGKDFLVVDDVMTTGSTLNAVANSLKGGGARSVTNLCLARTLPK